MGTLFFNRYVDAWAKTMIMFAAAHIVISTLAAIGGNISALNVFKIISLDLFIPSLGQGTFNFIMSYCAVLGIYILAFRYGTRLPKDRG